MQIDHIDHDRSNNSANNLRATNNLLNGRNQSLKKTNTSGFNGVSWSAKYQRWQATISINGKTKHLGRFTDKQDAVNARQAANQTFKFHQNHGAQSKKEAA